MDLGLCLLFIVYVCVSLGVPIILLYYSVRKPDIEIYIPIIVILVLIIYLLVISYLVIAYGILRHRKRLCRPGLAGGCDL